MNAALYVDLLGTRAGWKHGAESVLHRLASFEELVVDSLREARVKPARWIIETDTIILCFGSARSAVRFGTFLFRKGFDQATRDGNRTWLRGVIGPVSPRHRLRRSVRIKAAGLTKYLYSRELFALVNAEKSGFKGMRLLVAESLIDPPLEAQCGLTICKRKMSVLTKLRYSWYPTGLPFNCRDVLWCLSPVPGESAKLNTMMQRRLRWSTKEREEFEHAASTQVLFHESYGLIHGFRRKGGPSRADSAYDGDLTGKRAT